MLLSDQSQDEKKPAYIEAGLFGCLGLAKAHRTRRPPLSAYFNA